MATPTPSQAPAARRRVVADARRENVASLIKAGASHRAIARQLGVTHTTINHDVTALRKQWSENALHDATLAFEVDLLRLDDIITSLTVLVRNGDLEAIDRYLKVLKMRGDMYGYRAPVRAAITGGSWPGSAPISIQLGSEPDYSRLNDAELTALVAKLAPADGE